MDNSIEDELTVMHEAGVLLSKLTSAGRQRTLSWLNSVYGGGQEQLLPATDNQTLEGFYKRAQPETDAGKVLVVMNWLSSSAGKESLSAREITSELKQLGEKPSNVTRALYYLEHSSPQLVNSKKSRGGTKQAQKLYQLTAAGREKYGDLLR